MSDVKQTLVTRNEVRAMGLNVSNTQFRRYEKEKKLLTPIKVGQFRSAIVYYALEEVQRVLPNIKFVKEKPRSQEPS